MLLRLIQIQFIEQPDFRNESVFGRCGVFEFIHFFLLPLTQASPVCVDGHVICVFRSCMCGQRLDLEWYPHTHLNGAPFSLITGYRSVDVAKDCHSSTLLVKFSVRCN